MRENFFLAFSRSNTMKKNRLNMISSYSFILLQLKAYDPRIYTEFVTGHVLEKLLENILIVLAISRASMHA